MLTAMRRSAAEPAAEDPLAAALERVGDRWAMLLVAALLGGPRRFNDLLASLPGLAPNILVDRLRRLESAGVAVARPYSTRPPRSVYELTGRGRDLADALRLLADWGAAPGEPARRPGHAPCGTALQVRWYCPTCACTVHDEPAGAGRDADGLHWV